MQSRKTKENLLENVIGGVCFKECCIVQRCLNRFQENIRLRDFPLVKFKPAAILSGVPISSLPQTIMLSLYQKKLKNNNNKLILLSETSNNHPDARLFSTQFTHVFIGIFKHKTKQ